MKTRIHSGVFVLSLILFAGAHSMPAQPEVVISEFMAANTHTLQDETGQYPDWIELCNTTATNISLEGWFLTDTTNNLMRWRFPATDLPPHQFLVVFASGRSQTNAGLPLHCDFKLSASGEYLALVKPDGLTIASQFYPLFPPQYPDISFGAGQNAVLVADMALARVLVPSDGSLGQTWTSLTFNDSAWLRGTNGVGFLPDSSPLVRTDVRAQMLNQAVSAYVRIPFLVTNAAALQTATLSVNYDDGFVAYLNGAEVARRNAPNSPAWNTPATGTHSATAPETIDLTGFLGLFQEGSNVLALHGMNSAATDNDFLVLGTLGAFTIPPLVYGYETTPTPGQPNVAGYPALVETIVFSPPGGVLTNDTVVVTLSCATPGALIYYTTDNTVPSNSSLLYTGPITITGSVAVRARAFRDDLAPSPVRTEGYTLLDRSLFNFSSPLPLVILDTYNQDVTYDMNPKAPATVTIIDTEVATGRAKPVGRWDLHGRAGVSGHGQTAFCVPGEANCNNKRSYNLEFWNEDDKDQKASVLGFPSGSDFVLASIYTDKSFMNDFLGMQLFADMGHYSVRRRYVEVFWNGLPPSGVPDPSGKVGTNDYVGIYLLQEKIRIDPNRVNISLPQSGNPGDPITGGYIFKKDKLSPGENYWYTSSGQNLLYYHPAYEELTQVQRDWLVNYLNEYESVLYGPNWKDPVNGYAKYISVDSFVDMQWIVEFTKQIDGYRLSNYIQKDRGKKICMEPIWDWDLSFGNANYLECGRTNGWYYTLCGAGDYIWLDRLVRSPGDPDFLQKITDRWSELRADVFNISNLLARVDAITNHMSEAIIRDFNRWPRLGRYVWPNPNGAADNPASSVNYVAPTTYAGLMSEFKKWLTGRYGWIDSQFLPAPVLSRSGGTPAAPLGMYAPTGAIWFTFNGSDPRLPGGAISPTAQFYTTPVTLPPMARVVARTYSTASNLFTRWSPAVNAAFGDPVPALAITEIMYHPAADAQGINDLYEFVELTNAGTNALDMTGVRLTGGINLVFPPGPLVPAGSTTTNDFDNSGTGYALSKLGGDPGAAVTADGPAGHFLRLVNQGAGTNRNRIAFDQTAGGPYDHLVAEFDFRAANATAPPPEGTPTAQDFDNPGTHYVLNSFDADPATPVVLPADANSTGNFLRLTEQVGSESDGVYFDVTEQGTNRLVMVNFDFRCQGSADGFGFAFLNTATYGTNGVGPAFSEEPNLANSIGVGFDIYNNNTPPAEPNANHVSLHWNGAQVSIPPATPNLSLSAGVFHRAQITIKFESTPTVRALVTVKITPNVNGTGGASEVLFNNFVISAVPAYRGRAAFCARTGGAWANQDIDNISIHYYSGDIPAAGGLSMQLLPVSVFGTNGPGSRLADFTDVPAATNLFGLNFDMSVVDFINNVNLYWNGAQGGDAFVPRSALRLDSGVFHHARLELTRVSDGTAATVTLTPDVFGASGPPITVLSNLVLSGFYPADARIEFAGRSGGQNLNVDVDNVSVWYEEHLPNLLGAGQQVVLVRDQAAFESRYGVGLPIAGEFAGQLDNAGDHLVLYARSGAPILDFNYNNNWRPITDGLGFSLVCVTPTAPASFWNDPANWRASSQPGGSPGASDPAPAAVVPVLVNEALSHPDPSAAPGMDAIELYNPSPTQSADVGHWYLTDDFNVPGKYQIPSPTVISPGGYAVFYESQFNAPEAGTNRFGLRAEGESVCLFSADAAGNLTGYYHGFDFGASDQNVSFGRHVDSQGREHFVAQEALTLGTNNAGPRVGPVVISEIMYHPPEFPGGVDNQAHEFVELHNRTGEWMPLFDPLNPANTWHLRGGVDFHFPAGVQIPADGYALVVSFDPAWDIDSLNSFRSHYGLGPEVPLFGPYHGKLNNAGDNVELADPVVFGTNTANPSYVLVDKVAYDHAWPWPPAADGLGFSLQRINEAAYGNDPINWTAGPPTPAARFNPGAALTITVQPQDQTVLAFGTASLSVAAGGPGPCRYQWRYNGENLAGATNAALLLPNVRFAQTGPYQVVVFNGAGSTLSSNAFLTVLQGPTVLAAPTNRTIWPGSNTTFTVSAFGNGPLSYQWRFNGSDLAGATSPSLAVTNVQPSQAGNYSVVLSDAVGSVELAPAQLTLLIKSGITQQPASQTLAVGDTVALTVQGSGTAPLWYRWRKNNTTYLWPGNAQLLMPNAVLTNAGRYDVIITNLANALGGGYIQSSNAVVLVVAPPTNQSVLPGANVTVRAIVGQPMPFTNRFLWLFNGAVVATGTNQGTTALGTFTNDLLLANLDHAQEGFYTFLISNAVTATNTIITTNPPATNYVVVTNLIGAPAAFTASIIIDSDGDGMPDWWESLYGLNPTDPSDAAQDADGDGMTNLQEYLAGTNPRNAQSYLRMEADGAVAGGIVLEFNAVSNRAYAVYYREAMSPVASWLKLQDISAASVNRVIRLTNAPATTERYYRLSIPAQP